MAAPGAYVATYVGAGEPVLIARGDDGVLRAFSNVCRHHAARVAEGCGEKKVVVLLPYLFFILVLFSQARQLSLLAHITLGPTISRAI